MIKPDERKIKLRDWLISDVEKYEHWLSGDFEWMKFDGPYFNKISKIELEKRIISLKNVINKKSFSAIRKRLVISNEKNDFLGIVSRYWISEETNWLAIGIDIYDEKNWGKSYGLEALKLWIDYLFQKIEFLRRLDLQTWSGNKGMIRLAQKLGFTLEAKFRDARIVDGNYYDALGFGILKTEWNSQNLNK